MNPLLLALNRALLGLKITEWLGLEGEHLVQSLCSIRNTQSRLPRIIFRWILKNS